jgi:tetratricopeptide (TPR) repeat protein
VLLLTVAVVVVLTAIALSLSRGGAIALFAAAAVLSAVYWRWRLVDARYLGGLAVLALVMLAILSVYGYDRVAKRFDEFSEGTIDAIDHGDARRTVWAANVSAIQNGWLTGYGAGSHRDVCPVYLTESTSKYYSHAENGYLQIVTENGVAGAVLLASALALCGGWCMACLMRLTGDAERLAFGAAAAGLAASAVHSLVDFVWYIPACLSVTLLLAVCVLRLAQLAAEGAGVREQGTASREQGVPRSSLWLSRPTWLELAAVAIVAGGWTVYAYFGPAIAAVHWDRFLRASVANSRLVRAQLSALDDPQESIGPVSAEPLAEIMLTHLEQVIAWDPSSARAHLKLAGKYLVRFEMAQQQSENAMLLGQIRDAALSSNFASSQELRDWLRRAFGENVQWLYRAYDHAGQAAALSPLQGEAYLYRANLCFLENAPPPVVEAYVEQGLRVRPCDGDVLFEVGMHKLMTGQLEAVISIWAKCFRDSGDHQLRIVETLAGRIPAAVFIQEFQPDWRTLREIWARYRQLGQPQDLTELVSYAAEVTKRQVAEETGIRPAYIWLWQASMFHDVDRPDDALLCLEQAARSGSHNYAVRLALGQALMKAGRFNEAEAHVRWCLARRPENKSLSAALVEITKQGLRVQGSGFRSELPRR